MRFIEISGRSLLTGTIAVTLLSLAFTASATAQEKPYTVKDGVVDWYTFSGFRRYHSECHVCHGPDGLGSSFAPSLVESMKTMDYSQFLEIVVNGKQEVGATGQKVMPAFAENLNVMCFIDDLYAYLKARSDGAVGRGRPQKEAKPDAATERDNACLG